LGLNVLNVVQHHSLVIVHDFIGYRTRIHWALPNAIDLTPLGFWLNKKTTLENIQSRSKKIIQKTPTELNQ
jgi:dihydroorotase